MQKIKIRLKSYDPAILDSSCLKILDIVKETGAKSIGPIPLPTKRRVYCVLKSPHVNKDAREHFEIRTHRRIIEIQSSSLKTIETLARLDLVSGVDIEVKL